MDSEGLIKRLQWYVDDHWSDPLDKEDAQQAIDTIKKLSAELAEACKDAERWRWIRDEAVWRGEPDGSGDMVWCVIGPNAYNLTPIDGDELDDAVDARLAALASEQPQASGEKT